MRHTLSDSINNWYNINASTHIIEWVYEGVKFPLQCNIPSFEFPNKQFSVREDVFIQSEINNLLLQGQIEVCEVKPKCVSPLICVTKKNNSFRLVSDLRNLNVYCPAPKFKYEDINTVISLIKPKDFLVAADLKDGFHHIKAHKDHRTYLGFQFKGIYYQWTVLPYGHSCSPYLFCKILRPVVTYLRSLGIRVVLYVDDFLLMAQHDVIDKHKDRLLHILDVLGWTVNWEKSSLTPSLCKVFIGYLIDNSKDYTFIKIPKDRIRKLRKDIQRVLTRGITSARALARVAGQCVSMYKCVLPAKLLLRNLYRLLKTRQSWQDTLHIDNDTAKDLQWWYDSLSSWNGLPVGESNIECQTITDASSSGWGAWIPGNNAQGFWNNRLSNKHSNYRELFAVLMGLHSFKEFLIGKNVQVLSDNVTTVAFLHQWGIPERIGFCSTGYSYSSYGLENYVKQQVRFRENELESRPVIKSQFHIRVDVTSQPVSFNRSNLGATSDRSFCVHVNDSARDI